MFDNLERMNFAERKMKLLESAAARYSVLPEQCHVGHLLLQAFYEDPDFTHQIDAGTGECQTNSEVATRSTRLASALRNSGLKPGDHVVIMGDNNLEIAMPFYACHYNGYAVCPMDPSNVKKDITVLFSNVQPKIVFCSKAKEEEIELAISSNGLKCGIVTFDGDYNLDAFIKEFKGTEKGFSPEVFDQTTTNAWLLLTSGTTGLPKVAVVTYKSVMNTLSAYWASSPFRLNVVLAMATIQWLSTIVFFVSTPVMWSTRVQTSKKINTEHIREIVNKYKPYFTVFTPHILRQFLQKEGDACDMSSLLCVVLAGSVVPKPLFDQLQEKCAGFVLNAYGMTELVVPIFKFVPGLVTEGSVGIANPENMEYRLIDDDGNDIKEANKVGELWVKAGPFFKGYLNNPEETEKMITPDGWVKTGDLFFIDDNQCYHFKERRRVLIKYMSRFVAPMEIEDVIRKHPGVADACVVGVAHPDYVQLAVAAIMKRNGCVVEPSEIFSLVREELPELKQLHGGLFFVDALPMTPSGKINRSKVLELAFKSERILSKLN